MNSEWFFPIVSTVAILLSASSFFTSLLNSAIKSPKIIEKKIDTKQELKEQLAELESMQQSLRNSLLQKEIQYDPQKCKEIEELISKIDEIITKYKQYKLDKPVEDQID